MNQLTFATLRYANTKRLPQFKNGKGEPAHDDPEGKDWSPAQWFQAMIGEAGEYANKRKKFERGDINEEEFLIEAKKELADVQIYLDLLAHRLGIDLGAAVQAKFNEVSERIGATVFLADERWPVLGIVEVVCSDSPKSKKVENAVRTEGS